MTTRRLFASRALTNPVGLRLAPSGPRPNALPLHNVRYWKTRRFEGASFRQRFRIAKRLENETSNGIGRIGPSPRCRPTPVRPPREKTLVEPDGIEPTTSCLQSTRSPN